MGMSVGRLVGTSVGVVVGTSLGVSVGMSVGVSVGVSVGALVHGSQLHMAIPMTYSLSSHAAFANASFSIA